MFAEVLSQFIRCGAMLNTPATATASTSPVTVGMSSTTDIPKPRELFATILNSLISPRDEHVNGALQKIPFQYERAFHWSQHLEGCTEEVMAANVPVEHRIFVALEVPNLDLSAYIHRICSYMRCSAECFITSLVLLHRACKIIPLTSRSMHRLFAAVMVIAAKMHDDRCYPMSYYASVCGTTAHDLKLMEIALMGALDWNATVSATEYVMMLFSIRSMCWSPQALGFVHVCITPEMLEQHALHVKELTLITEDIQINSGGLSDSEYLDTTYDSPEWES